jgi:hypothetical protein
MTSAVIIITEMFCYFGMYYEEKTESLGVQASPSRGASPFHQLHAVFCEHRNHDLSASAIAGPCSVRCASLVNRIGRQKQYHVATRLAGG